MKKKELQKDIESKLQSTFGHLAKDAEKKFSKVVKKVSKLLIDVLHKKETKTTSTKTKITKKSIVGSSLIKKPVTKKKTSVKIVKKTANKKK
jgi:hypothetical protein